MVGNCRQAKIIDLRRFSKVTPALASNNINEDGSGTAVVEALKFKVT